MLEFGIHVVDHVILKASYFIFTLLVYNLRNSNYFPSSQEGAASVYTMADGSIGDLFGGLLYSAGQQANEAVQDQLSALSFTRFVFVLSFAKCISFCIWMIIVCVCSGVCSNPSTQFGSYFWGRASDQPFSMYTKCFTTYTWLYW